MSGRPRVWANSRTQPDLVSTFTYVCLPDTVDLRRPAWAADPRPAMLGRREHGAGWRAALGRHEADGPQDGERLPAVRDRKRGRPGQRGGEVGRGRVTFCITFSGPGLKYCSATSRLHWLRGLATTCRQTGPWNFHSRSEFKPVFSHGRVFAKHSRTSRGWTRCRKRQGSNTQHASGACGIRSSVPDQPTLIARTSAARSSTGIVGSSPLPLAGSPRR